jgi:hypothetical protein
VLQIGKQAVFCITCKAPQPFAWNKIVRFKHKSMIRVNRVPTNGLHTVFQAINELTINYSIDTVVQ